MTLNQIIQRLKELAASHRVINYYFVGIADDFLAVEDVSYPALFIELNEDANISSTDMLCTFNFKMYFLDQMDVADKSLDNVWDVTSDMMQVAQDYLAMLTDNTYYGWEVSEDYTLNILDYQLEDLTCGVSVDVPIAIRFENNRCQVPTSLVLEDYVGTSLTLNQVLKRLEIIGNAHDQINHYFCGSFDEFLDGSDVIYPAIFGEINKTSSISLANRLANYSFSFHFFDLMDIANNSLANEWDVKSDMISVAMDFIALLNYPGYSHSWTISEDISVKIRDFQLQDLCAGVSITLNIGTRYDANLCQVPIVEEGNFLMINDSDLLLINEQDYLIIYE